MSYITFENINCKEPSSSTGLLNLFSQFLTTILAPSEYLSTAEAMAVRLRIVLSAILMARKPVQNSSVHFNESSRHYFRL